MSQDQLFYEDILAALGEVVRALGGNKVVGAQMRPELPVDQASQWVRDCLNANRREKFDPGQVMWLLRKGRESGCHAGMHFICDDAGYERSRPTDPKDQLSELQDRAERLLVELKGITDRQERLVRSPIQIVKTA